MGEAEHLHEVGHGAFAAVVLPVGVGDERVRISVANSFTGPMTAISPGFVTINTKSCF
jgi:hypothetical protein